MLGAAFAKDSLFQAHAWVLFFVLLASTVLMLRNVGTARAAVATDASASSAYMDGVIRYGVLGLSPEELARRRGKLH